MVRSLESEVSELRAELAAASIKDQQAAVSTVHIAMAPASTSSALHEEIKQQVEKAVAEAMACHVNQAPNTTPPSKAGTLYVIQEREFLQSRAPVFKVGRTAGSIQTRMCGYPRGSAVVTTVKVADCFAGERALLSSLAGAPERFRRRSDIGAEYFEVVGPAAADMATAERTITMFVAELYTRGSLT